MSRFRIGKRLPLACLACGLAACDALFGTDDTTLTAAVVTGVVQNSAGSPVAGATVSAVGRLNACVGEVVAENATLPVTTSDGSYSLLLQSHDEPPRTVCVEITAVSASRADTAKITGRVVFLRDQFGATIDTLVANLVLP